MFYKILFKNPIEYDALNDIDDLDGNLLQTQINEYTGLDSVLFSNSQIDILLDDNSEIAGLQVCNECIKTFDIESHLLHLTTKLLNDENSAELFDGSGFSEFMNKGNIEEYLD